MSAISYAEGCVASVAEMETFVSQLSHKILQACNTKGKYRVRHFLLKMSHSCKAT